MLALHGTALLVVDDDKETLALYLQSFERLGARVNGARDAMTALSILSAWTPHVVLCDLHLPDIDGHMLLAMIRERAELASIPVIAISGSHPDVERTRSLRAGFAAHVVKPARLATVVLAIHAVRRPLPESLAEPLARS